uniref:nuclear transport factor 2 family protein n=2 Tax=Roseivirga sp. TaxID=1964215 RepID=UPI004047C3C8
MKQPLDFFSIYQQAAWNQDTESMINLYHENVMIYDMWENGYQIGLAAWSVAVKDWLGSLGEEKVRVTFEMIDLQEASDLAFGSALVTYQAIATDNEVLRGMKNRLTVGFRKEKEEWKVIHQHTSAPVDAELVAILDFE